MRLSSSVQNQAAVTGLTCSAASIYLTSSSVILMGFSKPGRRNNNAHLHKALYVVRHTSDKLIAKELENNLMGVSYNLRDKGISIANEIEAGSIEIITKLLAENKHYRLTLINIDPAILKKFDLRFLKELSLMDIPLYDYSFLQELTSLHKLSIGFQTLSGGKAKVNTVPNLESLKELHLDNIRNIRDLPFLKNLEVLDLKSIKNEDCKYLTKFKQLKDLWISQGSLYNYNALYEISKLQRLRVIAVRNFNLTLTDAVYLENLRHLELCLCPSIRSLDFLYLFKNLLSLVIDSCNNLKDLKGVSNCQKIEVLSVSTKQNLSGSLDSIVNVKNVCVGSISNKKTISDFEKKFKGNSFSLGLHTKGNFDFLNYYKNNYLNNF